MLAWFLAFALVVQAAMVGWMQPAAAEAIDPAQIDGWVVCIAKAKPVGEPAKHGKGNADHDLTCTLCATGCAVPLALLSDPSVLPAPSETGRAMRMIAAEPQPRGPPFTLAKARAPPSAS